MQEVFKANNFSCYHKYNINSFIQQNDSIAFYKSDSEERSK